MKNELIEALKMLARGRIDAAETIAELLMPESKTFDVRLSDIRNVSPTETPLLDALVGAAKKKAK